MPQLLLLPLAKNTGSFDDRCEVMISSINFNMRPILQHFVIDLCAAVNQSTEKLRKWSHVQVYV